MELVKGESLQKILMKRSFRKEYSDKQIMRLLKSIIDALSYIASKGIMHRDLKPDNILVGKDEKVKIVDFGLAAPVNNSEQLFMKCGTPGYIAPEVLKYDSKTSAPLYDGRCDLFSAGCIFYYM